jgi:hypothetical protein
MEVFKAKGFLVRKINFHNKRYGGHFCFEVFYHGSWHFFDPDLEPEIHTLAKLGRPGIRDLSLHPEVLNSLYAKNERTYVLDKLTTYTYGRANRFPAANARVYQYITKYLSYTLWFWLILLYFFVRNRFHYTKKKQTCVELQDSLAPAAKA